MRGRSDGAKSRPFCVGAAAGLAPPVSAAPSGQRASGRAVAMTAEALRKVRRVDMRSVGNSGGGSEGRNSKGRSAAGWGRAARLRARDGARSLERVSSDWGRQGQPKWIGKKSIEAGEGPGRSKAKSNPGEGTSMGGCGGCVSPLRRSGVRARNRVTNSFRGSDPPRALRRLRSFRSEVGSGYVLPLGRAQVLRPKGR